MYNEILKEKILKESLLQEINKSLTSKVPLVEKDISLFSRPKGIDIWTSNINGVPCGRMIIYLRSDVGCEHGSKTGGCSGCKHWRLGTAGKKLNIPDMYIKQYLSAVNSHGLKDVVSLYNEGNILNSEELPFEQLLYIIGHMAQNSVKKLILESRPEFIDQEKLNKIREISGNMIIEVGIGLESANEFIRNELFLKNIDLDKYEEAVETLNNCGFNPLTYVLLKPAFLNELQAMADAVKTIKYAFSIGTKVVSLEPVGVEPYTLTEILYETGNYSPPMLWSVLDVVKQTYTLGEIRIGSCQIEPRPTSLPSNCEYCTNRFLEQFEKWNQTYDISVINDLYCSNCHEKYINSIKYLDSTISEKSLRNKVYNFTENYYSINAVET